ncbi:hypothetical protein AVEN_256611-1 [Araneus ventricosus]|uniref:Uncharacterized protein n=1 Tax=Araneus ventricosus TaxID=182803 RepID=A0A4Y2SXP4_ARAVE|nr:hypothetical protein AVEN_256611-1 [Araneus ventricosus]
MPASSAEGRNQSSVCPSISETEMFLTILTLAFRATLLRLMNRQFTQEPPTEFSERHPDDCDLRRGLFDVPGSGGVETEVLSRIPIMKNFSVPVERPN